MPFWKPKSSGQCGCQAQASAAIRVGPARNPGIGDYLLHPIRTSRLKARLKENPQAAESYQDRMTMYLNLRDRLTGQRAQTPEPADGVGPADTVSERPGWSEHAGAPVRYFDDPACQDKYGSQIDPVVVIEELSAPGRQH
ncbi:MAG: hypothetical protein R2857_11700 [Vampirovibrionales bacterium]